MFTSRAVYITIKQYMQLYAKSKSAAYRDVQEPGFPVYRVGKAQIRIDKTKLEDYFKQFN